MYILKENAECLLALTDIYGQEYLIRKNVDILTKVNKSLKSHIILLFINHRKKNWPEKIKFPLKWWKSRLNPVNQAGEN